MRGNCRFPLVVDEPLGLGSNYRKSYIRQHADQMRCRPTPAEHRMKLILNGVNDGALRGSFESQHVVSGKWIVDFFFPKVRLAIEIDGSIHNSEVQKGLDLEKDRDCARFDITVLRITNEEVFGDCDALVERLREGWRQALRRENLFVGKPRSRAIFIMK